MTIALARSISGIGIPVMSVLGILLSEQPAISQSSTTTSSFPFQASITNPAGNPGFDSASRQRINSIGSHSTSGRIGAIIETVSDGSGVGADPETADYSLTVSALKNGYGGSTPPTAGEIDGIFVSVRQDDGDANLISLNGGIIDRGSGNPNRSGYLSMIEGHSTVVNPTAPYAITQDINVQVGITNPRDNSYVGFYTRRATGNGGVAIWSDSKAPAAWDYGLRIANAGTPQLEQRTSDAALLFYPASGGAAIPVSNSAGALTVGGNLTVTGSLLQTSNWVAFSPSVTPLSGAFGTAPTAAGRYNIVGRTCTVEIEVDIPNNGSAAGAIAVSLPAAAYAAGRHYIIAGREDGVTGKMLQGIVNVNVVRIIDYANAYPAVSGAHIIVTGSYELS